MFTAKTSKMKSKRSPIIEPENATGRLAQMRESQRRLRNQRKHELEEMKEQNRLLLQEKEKLEHECYKLRNEFAIGFSLFDDEITSNQLEKLLTDIDLQLYGEAYDLVPLEEFIKFGKFESQSCLFLADGTFILKEVCKRSLTCLNQALKNYRSIALKDTPFRFVKSYGLEVMKYHIDTMRILVRQNKVPRSWMDEDKVYPKGALSIAEVLHYVCSHTELKTLNSYILCSFMSRYSFSTVHGMAMFEHDLLRCIEYAESSSFDEAFLLGTVDENLCPSGAIKPLI